MLVLIGLLLVLIPVVAIVYPFLRRQDFEYEFGDEGAPHSELSRRWEAAVGGLKNAELERAIGNLSEEDYRWLKERYMTDAATVLKAMELEERQEGELLAWVEVEVRKVREGVQGGNGEEDEDR